MKKIAVRHIFLPLMSPHRNQWEESFVLKFFHTELKTTQEQYKNGEDHKIGDSRGTPMDS
jgi:hypothetical protein